jgi:hypothetical protein
MIKIPHNRAIELLRERLRELNFPTTDLAAWKNRVLADVEGIFGGRTTQWFAISGVVMMPYDREETESNRNQPFRKR